VATSLDDATVVPILFVKDNLKSRELDLIGWYLSHRRGVIGSELCLVWDQLILFYQFEKQSNTYIPQSMMACVRLAPMLGNIGLRTRLPTR